MSKDTFELIPLLLLLPPFLLSWVWIVVRYFVWRKPVLPRLVPARLAKWGALSVCFIFFMFVLLPECFMLIFVGDWQEAMAPRPVAQRVAEDARPVFPEDAPVTQAGDPQAGEKSPTPHPLTTFLLEDPSAMKFIFAFFVAALLIPFAEEFVFRVVIQGWLERQERLGFGMSRRNGWRSMILAAIFFAMMHIRGADSVNPPADWLGSFFACGMVARLVLLMVAFIILRDFCHASWRDLGMDFRRWRKDILLGTLAFGVAAFPAYLLMLVMRTYCSGLGIVADPIALMPLSLVLGLLYWRTHRILPCFVTHFLFNCFALLLSLLGTLVAFGG